MRLIIYRDLAECKDKNGYEEVEYQPGMLIVKEGVLPGLFGFPPLCVRHLYSDDLLIVCSTDYEMSPTQEQEVIKVARARFCSPVLSPDTCPQCLSKRTKFDQDYGFRECQDCGNIWALASEDPDNDEALDS